MSSNLPTVSVVIPARSSAEVLPRALSSVRAQTYPNIVDVVVAAADPSSAAAAGDGAVVVINEQGSTPVGLNLAVAAGKGDIVVRCDAHSTFPPRYVERAVATLQRTGAANVGGMQVPVGETPWQRAIAEAMKSPFGAGDARYRIGGEEGPVETVYLGVFRRSALELVGGFDETFARNQDYELNHRLIEAGQVVWFDPELRVEYTPRGSLSALARQYFGYGRAKRQFVRRHPGSLRWRQLAPPLLTAALASSVLISIWWPVSLLGPLLYVFGLLVVSLGSRSGALKMMLALGTMHLSWGLGFLVGNEEGNP
ncbi:MAG TPA: glycosyltransferase family 2 protein [Acidimicrobiia bacterium]|nr:glycosyltransferase family 2 protein [Acidimicrobiia bacterium]